MKILRRTYDWVLHWAKTPYGAIALFILAFAESSFFPIPPDVLLIALCLGAQAKAFRYATICTVASVLGAIAGFAIGHFVWLTTSGEFTSVATFFFEHVPGFTETAYNDIKGLYDEYNFWIIFTAGFTPIPYKVFTISAGAFDISFVMFIIASVLSRGGRFFLIAFLIWKYGAGIERFIDKYFNWLAIAFTVLLIGGFVLIKYLL
jgi:membrane protein YqaA with SNARE-associated domain